MSENYSTFINEAFIEPIRSVLIVDDDYPTIDEILLSTKSKDGEEEAGTKKKWHKKPDAVKKVIDEFRGQNLRYILDVHDAKNLTDGETLNGVEHLHQTDLLILDFELDRTKRGDGSLSLNIARKIMSNSHYNLVIVHTTKALESVFPKFLLGLLKPFVKQLNGQDEADLENALASIDRDAEEVAGLEFEEELKKAFSYHQFFDYWKNVRSLRKVKTGKAPFAEAKNLFERFGIDQRYWTVLSKHALIEFEKSNVEMMSNDDCGVTAFSSATPLWIRSDRAFISFAHKPKGGKLLDTLRKALSNWNPKPSRLFLTRLMAEIDDKGVEVQTSALDDNFSSAIWYHRMLVAEENELETCVDETIKKHTDEMMLNILPNINLFANRLVEIDKRSTKAGNFEVVQNHYDVDLSEPEEFQKSQLRHNAVACSQTPTGWHLQTGHVFEMDNEKWVCASPACDTVPNQISDSQVKIQGERLCFTAVKLHKIAAKIPKDVQSNRYVFLKNGEETDVYSIAANPVATPDWATLFAENRGKFDELGGMSFFVYRMEQDENTRDLTAKSHKVKVVAQLRYEYALNLIQKLSGSLSRVGLDFSG